MKNLLLLLVLNVIACKKEVVSTATTDCNIAKTQKEAIPLLKGHWKLTEIYAGRAGKQPVTLSVELHFDETMVEINENGKKTSTRYEVYVENGSQMLRISQPLSQSAYYESYKYFVGYLSVCENQLRVGMGPVDGADYVYTK